MSNISTPTSVVVVQTPPTVVIVAKDLRGLSKVLLILAIITGVLNILRLFSGQLVAILGLLVIALQVVVCLTGKSASESSGYNPSTLRNGAIGTAFIVVYYFVMTIVWIWTMSQINRYYDVDSYVLFLEWIVLLELLADLAAYSALFGLFIKHSMRAKRQFETLGALHQQQSATEMTKV